MRHVTIAEDVGGFLASSWLSLAGGKPMSWLSRANCRNTDPELFCQDNGIDATTVALMMCSRCPVLKECSEMTNNITEKGWRPVGLVQGGVVYRSRPTKDLDYKEWQKERRTSVMRTYRDRLMLEHLNDQQLDQMQVLESTTFVMRCLVTLEHARRAAESHGLLPTIPQKIRASQLPTARVAARRVAAKLRRLTGVTGAQKSSSLPV